MRIAECGMKLQVVDSAFRIPNSAFHVSRYIDSK